MQKCNINLNENFFNERKYDLFAIIKHCQLFVPYYKDIFKSSIPNSVTGFDYGFFSKEIPLLEKGVLKSNPEYFISDLFNKNDLLFESTSGTDGKPLLCYKSRNEKLLYAKMLWDLRRQK